MPEAESHDAPSRPSATPTISQTGPSTPDDSPLAPRPVPSRLGRYELRAKIGRGGFATVYRAWDPELRREVAIKLRRGDLWPGGSVNDRMEREAQSAARLRHPAIVPIHEVGQQDENRFIVCELLPGPSLAELIARTQPAPQQAAAWVARLADALDYAHQCGIVHRDVKPSNVLMDRDGQPTLADFGLAFDAEALTTLTQHGDILGTPAYMSPEQAAGKGHAADGRTDVYSLGVVLYELLAGQVPFQGNPASVLHNVIHDDPRPPRQVRSSVPLDLETICLKAMAKEPGRRYATAGAMATDLRAFIEHRPIAARRLGPIGRFARWGRRNPALASTIALAVAALAIVSGVSYTRVVRERDRFLAQRETAVANLYESLVREVRSIRLARGTGYRAIAWDRLKQAMEIDTPARDPESLRQEAVACLGDFVGNSPAVWERPAGIDGWISAVSIDPSGRLVAVAFTEVIQLREVTTGRIAAEFRDHKSGVYAMAFSSDGRTLVSMDDSGIIKVRSVARPGDHGSWTVRREIRGLIGAERHVVVAVSCVLTPDDEHLLACSKGEQRVRMWNVSTGELEFEFRGLNDEPFVRTAISGDGTTLVGAYRTAEMDGVVIWDVASRQVVKTLPVGPQGIVDVSFSGDGAFLACACTDGTYVFETTGWSRRTVVRSDDQFFTVAFHPDRPIVAVPTSRTQTVRLWDVIGNREVALLNHPGGPHSVAISPDGSMLVSASNDTVRLWNLRGGGEKLELAAHQGIAHHVKFSPDGKLLASGGGDTMVRLWDAATGRPLSRFSISPTALGKVNRVAFSPDSKRLAGVDWSGAAAVFDVTSPESPQRLATLLHHEQQELGQIVFDIAFSPDGQYVAAAGMKGIWVWRGDEHIATPTDNASVNILFSPDSRRIIWRQHTLGVMGVWNLESSLAETLPKPLKISGSYAFVSDHHLLHVEGRNESDKTPILRLTDVRTGESSSRDWGRVPSLVGELDFGNGFALTSDGSWLALSGANVSVWDLQARKLVLVLPAEASPVNSIDVSPDHSQLALGLTDGTVVVWHLPTLHRQLAEIGLGW